MSEHPSASSRLLRYWIAATLWFFLALVLAWGSTPVAVVFWSVPAVPLAINTYELLVDRGRATSRWVVRAAIALWIALILIAGSLMFADAVLAPYESYLQGLGVLFVVAVTGWGIWASARRAVNVGASSIP